MPMMLSDLERQISELLKDYDFDKVRKQQIRWWLYESQLAVIAVRMDALSVVEVVNLVAGSVQDISVARPGTLRVLDAYGNGTTGRYVTYYDRKELNNSAPQWRSRDQAVEVQHIIKDDKSPKIIHVTPPNDGTGSLELLLSVAPEVYTRPENLDEEGDDLEVKLDETFHPAMISWTCYRTLARDGADSQNWSKAQAFRRDFFELLGAKTVGDETMSKKIERLGIT